MAQISNGTGLYQILYPHIEGTVMGLTGADTHDHGVAVGLVGGPDRNDWGQLWEVNMFDTRLHITNQQTNTLLILAGTEKGAPVVCGGEGTFGAMGWRLGGDADEESAVVIADLGNDDLALAPTGPLYGLALDDNTGDPTQQWRFVRL